MKIHDLRTTAAVWPLKRKVPKLCTSGLLWLGIVPEHCLSPIYPFPCSLMTCTSLERSTSAANVSLRLVAQIQIPPLGTRACSLCLSKLEGFSGTWLFFTDQPVNVWLNSNQCMPTKALETFNLSLFELLHSKHVDLPATRSTSIY